MGNTNEMSTAGLPARGVQTIEEFAAENRVSYPTARRWTKQGILPVLRIGRRIYVRRSALADLLAGGREALADSKNGA
jgi:excisionase family DNA binding protein